MAEPVLEGNMEKLNLDQDQDGEVDSTQVSNGAAQDPRIKVLLCPELLDHVFKHLDLETLLIAQETCETWFKVVKLSLKRRLRAVPTKKLRHRCYSHGSDTGLQLRFNKFEVAIQSKKLSSAVRSRDTSESDSTSDEDDEILNARRHSVDDTYVKFKCPPPARQKCRLGPSAQWQTVLEHPQYSIVGFRSISLQNVLTVQDWNGLWPAILRDFKSLRNLNLCLRWYPEEEPMTQVEMTASDAVPHNSLEEVRIQVYVDRGNTTKFGAGIETTFLNLCPQITHFSLAYFEVREDRDSHLMSLDLFRPCIDWEAKIQVPRGINMSLVSETEISDMMAQIESLLAAGIPWLPPPQDFPPSLEFDIKPEIASLLSSLQVKSLIFNKGFETWPFFLSHTSLAAIVEKIVVAPNEFDLDYLKYLVNLPNLNNVFLRLDLKQFLNLGSVVPGQLESVERLELQLFNFGAKELEQISTTLFGLMPNLSVLVSVNRGYIWAEGDECEFLRNLSKLKKLKHFILEWSLHFATIEFVKKSFEHLTKCEALETITIRCDGYFSLVPKPKLKAIVQICGKVPKLRAVWIFTSEKEELVKLQKPGTFPDFVRVADSELDSTSLSYYDKEWLYLDQPLPSQASLMNSPQPVHPSEDAVYFESSFKVSQWRFRQSKDFIQIFHYVAEF